MYHRKVNFMHNILLVAVRLGSEEAVWRGSEKYVLLLFDQKKALKNSRREAHKIKLVHGFMVDFSMILIGYFP